jgi:hypothetical protein
VIDVYIEERKLTRFVADLGLIVWKIAPKEIESFTHRVGNKIKLKELEYSIFDSIIKV